MKMRVIVLVCTLAGTVLLAACGGGSNSSQQATTPNGNWTATLTSTGTTQQPITFTFGINQNGNTLIVSGMNFTNLNNCFGTGSVMSGQMMDSGGMMSGMQMQMAMEMWSNSDHTGNHLVLTMGMPSGNNNKLTGTFTLTGVTSGCQTETGTVTMTRM